jgi:hypothetical protein
MTSVQPLTFSHSFSYANSILAKVASKDWISGSKSGE